VGSGKNEENENDLSEERWKQKLNELTATFEREKKATVNELTATSESEKATVNELTQEIEKMKEMKKKEESEKKKKKEEEEEDKKKRWFSYVKLAVSVIAFSLLLVTRVFGLWVLSVMGMEFLFGEHNDELAVAVVFWAFLVWIIF